MENVAVRAEGLAKLYRIGLKEQRYETLAGSVAGFLKAPVRNFKRLRNLADVSLEEADGADVISALRDVSFEVQQGEVLGIIGANGAGKSTLLKILTGITEPSFGRAEIFGRVASLLEVGTGFHAELTGRENVYLNGTILGMKKAEIDAKFDEIVAFSGVEKFIDTPVKRYSSGMKVRLGFAVAAHLDPEILLIDEVLAVGDASFQKRCIGKMGEVARGGRTVLFVSHNMAAVSSLCGRALLLSDGRIKQAGDARDVVSDYLANEAGEPGEVRWEDPTAAPGNDVVRIMAVRAYSQEQKSPPFPIDRPLFLEVDYLVLQEGTRSYVALRLVDSTGSCVMASMNAPETSLEHDPFFCSPLSEGVYRTTCTIPANTLNDNRYGLGVSIVSAPPPVVFAEINDAISFTVADTGAMRPSWLPGRFLGKVRMRLDWQTRPHDRNGVRPKKNQSQ